MIWENVPMKVLGTLWGKPYLQGEPLKGTLLNLWLS